MKGGKIEDNFARDEQNSLNVTFDSIDHVSRDRTAKYRGEFNKVAPNFKGLPRDYYPTTCKSCA